MTWNWAALIAALLAVGTALYIRLRWRRSPQAFTAMVAVALCCFVAGAVLGAWVLHLLGPSSTESGAASIPATEPRGITFTPALAGSVAAGFAKIALAGRVAKDGYYCGTERWAVKTLSDEDAVKVDLKPVPSTVAQLVEMPRPATIMENRRAAPVELTTYQIRAVLLEIRDENDHDMHLVVADPADRRKTMITEIVDPGCSGAVILRRTGLAPGAESFEQLDAPRIGKGRF